MYLPTLLSLAFATLSLASPTPAPVDTDADTDADAVAPSKLRVVGVSVLGSGCRAGTADVRVVSTKNTAIEIALSDYIVQTGPDTMAADWRKNCKLTLNLEYDAGFQLSTLKTTTQGFAHLPAGVNGQCRDTIDFTGDDREVSYGIALDGACDGAFSLSASPDIALWSACGGGTAILNVNTECWISPTEKRALIAVDSISSKLVVRVALQWRKC
ncbi:uncharacterized protein C8A04DRAFT_24671 [Dichotomopilus funicola]|uniref:Secreted protein n=1 Tax=Dichotomopilus funicola TaxID=1934379 RepID=A0AAN6VC82_9PEZI|nr:hypothetical protein C8A04DRAFT_24671 [Dichotomopilus funicola]